MSWQEFNRGVFDYLIATDATIDSGEDEESDSEGGGGDALEGEGSEDDDEEGEGEDDDEEEEEGEEEADSDEDADGLAYEDDDDEEEEEEEEAQHVPSTKQKPNDRKRTDRTPATEKDGYGVSRGIDFKGVAFVVNFDFPATSAAYTHRIGRTARGGATGTALSFVSLPPASVSVSTRNATLAEIASRDENVLRAVQSQQPRTSGPHGDMSRSALSSLGDAMGPSAADEEEDESTCQPSPLQFNMRELDNFRYRVEDTLRLVPCLSVFPWEN